MARMRARGLEAELVADGLGADGQQRRAVHDARTSCPGVWTWLIFSIQWYFCSATASKPPISPIGGEGGLELAQRLDRRALADELVVVEDGVLVDVLHGDDRVREAALLLRGGGALLGAGGVGVHVVAGELLDRGDQVGADALRDEGRVVVGLGVHRPGAAVGAHRDAGHGLDAAGEDEVLPAGGDLLGGDVDGLEARGAEAVELDAGDRVRQAGLDRGGLGDVGALVADGGDAAEDDVVDAVGIKRPVARERLVHQADDEVDRLGRVQRAVALALAARGADGVEDECFTVCHERDGLLETAGNGSGAGRRLPPSIRCENERGPRAADGPGPRGPGVGLLKAYAVANHRGGETLVLFKRALPIAALALTALAPSASGKTMLNVVPHGQQCPRRAVGVDARHPARRHAGADVRPHHPAVPQRHRRRAQAERRRHRLLQVRRAARRRTTRRSSPPRTSAAPRPAPARSRRRSSATPTASRTSTPTRTRARSSAPATSPPPTRACCSTRRAPTASPA